MLSTLYEDMGLINLFSQTEKIRNLNDIPNKTIQAPEQNNEIHIKICKRRTEINYIFLFFKFFYK